MFYSQLVQIVVTSLKRAPLGADSWLKEAFNPARIFAPDWFGFLLPSFNEANSLFLAFLCFISIDAIRSAIKIDGELDEMKQEHSLIV